MSGLSLPADDPFGTALRGISLDVRAGEIVGIAGVSGNGQKELMAALSGERPQSDASTVTILGRLAGRLDAAQRRALGFAFVPEERLGRGAVPEMSLADNALLTAHREGMVGHGFIRESAVRAYAVDTINAYGVKAGGPDAVARSLSGGNLQKFIVGREIRQRPKVMIAAQPTWGVDVGAAAQIRQALLDLRDAGVAILVVSEELDELFEICDRLAVMALGRLSEAKPVRETNAEEIGMLMSRGVRCAGGRVVVAAARGPALISLKLEARPEPSRVAGWLSPLLAAAATLVVGFILFTAMGKSPWTAFHAFFVKPVATLYGVGELLLKATPLMLIAVGLAAGYRANVWNIGAEGQLTMGAIFGGGLALAFQESGSPLVLPLMFAAGAAGGLLWAAIPGVPAHALQRQRDPRRR